MADKGKVAIVLSGSGVYDGSEIHESVLSLLALDQQGYSYDCYAPDIDQHHVINHLNGEEMNETRNVLVESARIARGDVKPLSELNISTYDALLLPGGFGAAKNLSKWAFSGPDGEMLAELREIIRKAHEGGTPILSMCMGPTLVAKAFEGMELGQKLTVGTTASPSPYDIKGISEGMEKVGAKVEMMELGEIVIDYDHNLISTPCYMMDANVSEIFRGINKMVQALDEFR